MVKLSDIKSSEDLKYLSIKELDSLAVEIRNRIKHVTSENGGHIGPNLGVVELTLALHKVFSTPTDQFLFDVAHQGYVHKLLTGRNGPEFDKLRKTGGLSGFLARHESECDAFGAGHAGTALSAGLGMAVARDKNGTNEHIVSLIGDATLTCGISMEALNNVAANTNRMIVILNDNEWSIAKNVGAIAGYLNELITNPIYNRLHEDFESFLRKVPGGKSIIRLGSKVKQETKDFFVPSSLFEKYGMRYIGPVDGHDLATLVQYLEFCKKSEQPIVLHVLTKKGKGYDVAINNPEKFHGTGAFELKTGKPKSKTGGPPAYQDVFGKSMVRFARKDKRILGITGAMPSGTGLSSLAKAHSDQFFDVGIAEEHAVLFAAGMAARGLKPVCAIYSTFLQRAYDQIVHDVCLQNLDVTFCMDRAGLSPNDGPTHHGLFDITYLRPVPNVVLMQPKNEDELVDMMHTALEHKGPAFVRYPKGAAQGVPIKDNPQTIEIGKAELMFDGEDIMIWALGNVVEEADWLAQDLRKNYGINVGVTNARFVKPLDVKLLKKHAKSSKLIVTIEDGLVMGGFGSAVLEALQDACISTPVKRLGWPDKFIDHGSSVTDLREANGLGRESMKSAILEIYENCVSGSLDANNSSII